MPVQIRNARPPDAKDICRVLAQLDRLHAQHLPKIFAKGGVTRKMLAFVKNAIVQPAKLVAVAHDGRRIIGVLGVERRRSPDNYCYRARLAAHVNVLVVDRNHRHKGIGRALMKRAEDWAAEQRCSNIDLTVYDFNENAVDFYRELGFRHLSHKLSKTIRSGGKEHALPKNGARSRR